MRTPQILDSLLVIVQAIIATERKALGERYGEYISTHTPIITFRSGGTHYSIMMIGNGEFALRIVAQYNFVLCCDPGRNRWWFSDPSLTDEDPVPAGDQATDRFLIGFLQDLENHLRRMAGQ